MIYQISKAALARDKQKVTTELTDFFVQKNKQEKVWHLITAVTSSLRQKLLSTVEAQKITAFLSRKFDISRPAIELAKAFGIATVPTATNNMNMHMALAKRKTRDDEIADRLFLRLQSAVQEDLINYNQARSMVGEIIAHYPHAKSSLKR